MADKYCPQCGEKVDDAKAFCPACGHAFETEEKRTDTSAYEQADHTMQMGQTMYNAMLSDMGLNLKKEPEKRVEVLKPVVVQPAQTLQPVADTQAATTPPPQVQPSAQQQPVEKPSSKKFWIVTIVIVLLLLLIVAAAVLGIGLYLYFRAGTL